MGGSQQGGSDKNLTGKIWAVFLVSLVTSLGAVYWSYTNFAVLTDSIEALSRPGEKVDIINETFQEIIEAENHINSYILTEDTLSRTIYRNKIAGVRTKIARLRDLMADDSLQVKRVDTLQFIFDRKISFLEQFLRVKKLKQSSFFTQEALIRIAEQTNDTAFIDKQLLKREVLKGEIVPVEKEEVVITPDQFKGVSGLLRKLLGRDLTRIDTLRSIEQQMAYTYDVAVDTSIVREYYRDSTLIAVKDILALVMGKEVRLQRRLAETELDLLQQNQVFISNIRQIIEQIRYQEETITLVSEHEARALADESTRVLFVIGFIGLLMSGIFVFLILKDVTRASHYRRRLEQEKLKAEKLARVKEEFLSNMSHEIRTPLHNILGFSSLLSQTALAGRQVTYMKAINESNVYLSELVNGILDQAKIDSGKLVLAEEVFDLAKVARDLQSVFSHAAHRKNIALHVHTDAALDTGHVRGDAFRIKQVLNNLLGNAINFTDSGEVVLTVKAVKRGDLFDLGIIVADTGPGISEDKLASIFEPFVQGDAAGKKKSGTGLGLSIARRLVEAMGGSITVRNRPEGGAEFTVLLSLPCVAPVTDQEADTLTVAPPYVTNISVVMVEDDPWNSVLLKEILTPRVQTLHAFDNAHAALEFMRTSGHKPDLVFTDLHLPEMPGDVFMEEVKAAWTDITVVAVTAHLTSDDFNHLTRRGFDRVCKKPFRVADIEDILRSYFPAVPGTGSEEDDGKQVVANVRESLTRTHPYDIDFSEIRQFSGEDEAVFVRLVRGLIENNESQVERFGEYLRLGDGQQLAALSHQMKTMYDHLKLHTISESLASIELHARLGNGERLMETAHSLYAELKAVLRKLQEVRHQFHTA